MAWAQEMKNLVADIKVSHKDRTGRIGEIKRETQGILSDADEYMKQVSAELKEMAKNLKDFLADSEATRMKDFKALMGGIQAKIKEIKSDVRDFLAKSEERRIADFNATMEDIDSQVRGIRRQTQGILDNYKKERREAAGYWTSLKRREEVKPKEGKLNYREFVKEYLTEHKGADLKEAAKAWREYKG